MKPNQPLPDSERQLQISHVSTAQAFQTRRTRSCGSERAGDVSASSTHAAGERFQVGEPQNGGPLVLARCQLSHDWAGAATTIQVAGRVRG